MDKYEYRVKTEQMLEYAEQGQYKKAMEIADTIDWRRVKNASMLSTVSEIYEYNGEIQKSRDILFLAYDRAPSSRKTVYRLGILALKANDVEEATDCYEEFVKLAPRDPNQHILKYKILKVQNAALEDQIAALEDFKRAEYVEKWAYELACLYRDAGMISECLEECDDLILWFSEGKYVYQAMELKMKYKPLTPLQQDKYDSRPGAPKKEIVPEPVVEVVEEVPEVEEPVVEVVEEVPEVEEPVAEVVEEVPEVEEPVAEEVVKPASAITQVVSGATLQEALAQGVALASGVPVAKSLNIEEKAMAEKNEQLKLDGQMMIDDILAEWEEKQKVNADAIAKQKAEDEERLRKEREELERRREAERIERERLEAEAARKAAEEEAARRAAEEAARKAAEEEAARKAAEEAARKAAEEEAARKAAEEEAARRAAEEEAARKAAEEAAKKEAAKEAIRKAAEEAERKKLMEAKTQRLPDDIMQLVEQLESRVAEPTKAVHIYDEEDDYEEDDYSFSEALNEEPEPLNVEGLEELASAMENFNDEENFEEEDFEEDFEEELDLEAVFGDEETEEDFEEEFFGEEEEFEEDFEEEYEDYDEEDFEAEDFDEEDFDEDFEEEEFFGDDEELEEDYSEEDFEEGDFEEEDFEEEFDEDAFDEGEFDDEDFFSDDELPIIADFEEETPLEIEEPTEEEIQRRIKKQKGSGVPFDTGFVVTGRYDLSATSEIGLKAGLTEEQKKLFSYFVPVRGMSEQIVEVLDNDRRAQREGTSKTGNILVIGHKGSGKTVLSVDIVKAIQRQRNLKQGKVAIVTGESLNQKELSGIIQKLRGGAIIIEKAGELNSRTIKELSYLMEKKTGEMLFVLEDQRKPLERILKANPDFKRKFTSKLELPVFINDELVTFGQTYAKENGYKLDEMGILALYSRIDVLQREDHAVTVAEVKEIMDEAIAHSQKANVKHLARRVFGKSKDESNRIILKEEDFRI